MRIGTLRPASGATHVQKRRGKGAASGLGGTAGRGHKGHKARTGGKIPSWFEGGQMPIQRRLPKRGFKNPDRVEYQVVKVGQLQAAGAGGVVDAAWLRERRMLRRPGRVKLLAGGELKVAVTVRVDAASDAARKAIEAAGGKLELAAKAAKAPKAANAANAAKAAKAVNAPNAPNAPKAPKAPKA
jgi:large subunit ribosomal protein L15